MISTKNLHITHIVALSFTIFSFSIPAYAKYSGGTGEPNDPYQIATAEDLILLGDNPEDYDKHFILTADIDLNPNLPERKVFDKAVIGTTSKIPFTGVFDGDRHTISNLKITGVGDLALFGYLGFGAIVSGLGLEAVEVTSTGTGTGGSIGGLVGENNGSIINSYSTGKIAGYWGIGGLVGYNNHGSITMSYSTGAVSGDVSIGGLVGYNEIGYLTRCYSKATVTGKANVGGLVGTSESVHPNSGISLGYPVGNISNCYSTGLVTGNLDVGGLV